MRYSLKTKLSFTIALIVLLTVAMISLLANFLIGGQFRDYIVEQQKKTARKIVDSISLQYDKETESWDIDLIHTIGMYALYEGYIIKVSDVDNQIVWDAETHDMSLCNEVINEISYRMKNEDPMFKGGFTSKEFPAIAGGDEVGTVNISYLGPYFFSEDDFRFLDALNKILIGTGLLSLIISVIVGFVFAKRLSRPILRTVAVTKKIADGDYTERVEEQNSEIEIGELTKSINHLAETLEVQENLRRRLTSDVAHELRTPLTTVKTHIEALIEGVWEPSRERLQSCYDEMTRISNLVSDLEKLAKLENDNLKLNITEFNLRELSARILSNFETELKAKNQQAFVCGNCSDIYADRDRISQVLINLLSNAVKYTPPGGEIKIILSETDNSTVMKVEDNGTGIAGDELPFIFERFYRADKSRNRKTGGTGIGLTIVKSIVAAHGGTVSAESRLNEGSCFTVTLPINERK